MVISLGESMVTAVTTEMINNQELGHELVEDNLNEESAEADELNQETVEQLIPQHEPDFTTRDVYDEVNANEVAIKNSKGLIENAMNNAYAKKKLGYQAGDTISWSVSTSMEHSGTDMMGSASNLRYTGTTTVNQDINKISDDGTVSFKFNLATKIASLTRLKNKETILESGKGLTYSYSAKYSYRTSKKALGIWVQVEDRFGTIASLAKLSNIELEEAPGLIAISKNPTNILEQESSFPENSIAELVEVSQKMNGGSLTYEWLIKPDTLLLGEQIGRIRVTDTLGDYKHRVDVAISFTIKEKGEIKIQAPKLLEFKDYHIQTAETVVQRKENNWTIVVEDSRNLTSLVEEQWTLTAKAESSESGLEQYMVFIDENGTEHSLIEETPIYKNQEFKENTAINWPENKGFLLRIPKNNQLSLEKNYQTMITWNIVEGP